MVSEKCVCFLCRRIFGICRKYGNTGTELYRWRSDWWYYCFCEDYRYIYGDNKSNSRTLLDTMSKGVKEKRATKRHCQSIINNTSTCHLEHRHGSDPFLLHHRTGFYVLPVCQVPYNNS